MLTVIILGAYQLVVTPGCMCSIKFVTRSLGVCHCEIASTISVLEWSSEGERITGLVRNSTVFPIRHRINTNCVVIIYWHDYVVVLKKWLPGAGVVFFKKKVKPCENHLLIML